MHRALALLLLSVALLFQAAGPALAALSTDCLCTESPCGPDAAQPCQDSGTTCPAGQCGRSLTALAPVAHPDPLPGQAWGAMPLLLPTAHPPDSDLRPPIG